MGVYQLRSYVRVSGNGGVFIFWSWIVYFGGYKEFGLELTCKHGVKSGGCGMLWRDGFPSFGFRELVAWWVTYGGWN